MLWTVLFCSVFKCGAKCFSAYFCLMRTYFDVSCSTMSVPCMIFTGNNFAGDSFNYVFGSAAAILFVIHNTMLRSALRLKFERGLSQTVLTNKFKFIQ